MKGMLIKIHTVLCQFGLDPRRFLSAFRTIPAFSIDYRRFRRGYKGAVAFNPQLHDRYMEAGDTKSEYFWQDLIVARWIHQDNPERHVDVGSRTDGFVAHIASFREIEVFDVRPITTDIPGVTFRQADLLDTAAMAAWQDKNAEGGGYCDSLSCLHALEHFGLGRYGDPVDPKGYARGLVSLSALLKPQGRFYLATPMGRERVEFNANWVFAPKTILNLTENCGLKLEQLHIFQAGQGIFECQPSDWNIVLDAIAEAPYHLVILIFRKDL